MATEQESRKARHLMLIIGNAREATLKFSTITKILERAQSAFPSAESDGDTRSALLQAWDPVCRQAAVFNIIAKLYHSVYSNAIHRIDRLLAMMTPYAQAIDELQRAIELHLKNHASTGIIVANLQWFRHQLWKTQERAVKEREEDGSSADEVEMVGCAQPADATTQDLDACGEEESQEEMPIALYMQQNGPFQWKRDAPQLSGTRRLRKEDLRVITYHKLDGSFRRIKTTHETLFGSITIDHHEFPWLRFDAVNALWLSPSFDVVVDGVRVQNGYQTLLDAVMNVPEPRKRFAYGCTPLELATAMSKLSIDVGFVFSEDLHHVVWPLGDHTGNAHRIVVLCYKVGRRWRYSAVEWIARGESVDRSRVPTIEELLRRGKGSVQADFQGIVERSRRGWKPFPFLKLPAELRLKVYDAYFDFEDWPRYVSAWNIRLPELSKTCRQIRDETLPVFMSEQRVDVVPCRSRESAENEAALLRPEQAWMALSGAANIQEVCFNVRYLQCCPLRIRQGGKALWMRDPCTMMSARPHQKIYVDAFKELVGIIVADRTTPGLSMVDIAAMVRFVECFLIR